MRRMDETIRDETQEPEEDSTLTFRVKRSHFYAVTVPLAFLLGMAVAYLAWGQDVAPNVASAPAPAASGSESQPAANNAEAEERTLAEEVAEQIPNLPRHEVEIGEQDPSFGPADAAITIVEFTDFECPFCQRHFEQVYPQLLEAYDGQFRYVSKDFPLTSIHPNAVSAAMAAQCAHEQDAYWPYHDLLFQGGLGFSRSSYDSYAEQLELNLEQFAACLDEERYLEGIEADMAEAIAIGFNSTPTFLINGLALVGAQPYEIFEAIIDYELAQAAESSN